MHKKIAIGLFILSIIVMIAVVAADIRGKSGILIDKQKGYILNNSIGIASAFFLSFCSFWMLKYCKIEHHKA